MPPPVRTMALCCWLLVGTLLASSTASSLPARSGKAQASDGRESADSLWIAVLDPAREQEALTALADLGLEYHHYDRLHMAAIALVDAQRPQVEALPGVLGLRPNERMAPLLDRSAPYIGASVVWDTYRVRGAGVTTLVVDTGVDGSHPDVKYGSNLVENVVPTRATRGLVVGYAEGVVASDADGHGTHVAGIAGGTAAALGGSAAGQFRGIAWAGNLVGFQAGIQDPSTGESSFESVTILEAFNYALAKKDELGIRVVTNSWGDNGPFDPDSPVNLATLELYLAGLVVVFAAGNEGEEGPGTLNPYSVAPWVLSVAAGNYLNQRAPFSSIGTDPSESGRAYDHPDLMAPGVQITAARAAGDDGAVDGFLGRVGERELYASKSGTSMATPHVAGAAALLLSANPSLSPDDVYDLLIASATPLPPVSLWQGGAGYLNVLDAYRLARGYEGGLAEFLDGRVKYAGRLTGDDEFALDPVSVGLANGTTRAIGGEDTTLPDFAKSLVTTQQGITFLAGTVLLSLAAFRVRTGRAGE